MCMGNTVCKQELLVPQVQYTACVFLGNEVACGYKHDVQFLVCFCTMKCVLFYCLFTRVTCACRYNIMLLVCYCAMKFVCTVHLQKFLVPAGTMSCYLFVTVQWSVCVKLLVPAGTISCCVCVLVLGNDVACAYKHYIRLLCNEMFYLCLQVKHHVACVRYCTVQWSMFFIILSVYNSYLCLNLQYHVACALPCNGMMWNYVFFFNSHLI